MEGSYERIKAVIEGRKPDRTPLFDLIRNDAILEHFGGVEKVTPENGMNVALRAFPKAVDATRPALGCPREPGEETLPDGRRRIHQRWTTWTGHVVYRDADDYRRAVNERLAGGAEWNPERDGAWMNERVAWFRKHREILGRETFFLVSSSLTVGFMGLHGEVGLEQFSYFLHDAEDLILRQLRYRAWKAVQFFEHLPEDHGIEVVFNGDDMAYKSGLMVNPKWMRKHYCPLLKEICAACHRRGIKVMFHSDGNLNALMDSLVEAGIDLLNPIEIAAGMDLADLHKRYPHLVFAGGIDVSQLLPYGTPRQIRDTVVKAIEETEGKILVGSSTELHNEVPLENFMAMREAAISYRL